ncbi:MAG: polyhydroxyalkanoate synthesis repressor PhaR [Hyphomicrobiales bacterium]|nr:polyhydroxyalkanoate synthesis repressor PhaR [Hyphomicrobiales bacterium]
MTEKQPTTIKKYANRRLYNTGTSAYVTLEDLADMVKKGEDFEVFDAKTGDEITRSVLTQIIFEQESKVGQAMLPVTFLRQLIRFYGDNMQMLVPSYLEFTIDKLTAEQQKFRDQFASALGGPLAEPTRQMFQQLDEQTRNNMAMFRQALTMFNPFAAVADEPKKGGEASADLDDLRRQIGDMQRKIEGLSTKS